MLTSTAIHNSFLTEKLLEVEQGGANTVLTSPSATSAAALLAAVAGGSRTNNKSKRIKVSSTPATPPLDDDEASSSTFQTSMTAPAGHSGAAPTLRNRVQPMSIEVADDTTSPGGQTRSKAETIAEQATSAAASAALAIAAAQAAVAAAVDFESGFDRRCSTSSLDGGRRRGGYKCGNCGFFPKKTRHDCKTGLVLPPIHGEGLAQAAEFLANGDATGAAAAAASAAAAAAAAAAGGPGARAAADAAAEAAENAAAAGVSDPVKKKKIRKAYSVAGRPRQRGEYKCGRCGFFPKAAKHSCIEEKAKEELAKKEGRAAKKQFVPPPPPTPTPTTTSGGAAKVGRTSRAAAASGAAKFSNIVAGKKKSSSRTKRMVQQKKGLTIEMKSPGYVTVSKKKKSKNVFLCICVIFQTVSGCAWCAACPPLLLLVSGMPFSLVVPGRATHSEHEPGICTYKQCVCFFFTDFFIFDFRNISFFSDMIVLSISRSNVTSDSDCRGAANKFNLTSPMPTAGGSAASKSVCRAADVRI